MDKKKVVFLINSLGGGGAEKMVSLLIKNLRNQFDIHLVLLNNVIEVDFDQSSVHLKVIDTGRADKTGLLGILKMPLLALRLKRYMRQEGIGHCIAFLNRSNFIAAITRLLGWKGRIILCERIHTSSHYNKKHLTGIVGQWLVRHLYNHCDLLTTNSAGMAADLQINFKIKRPIKVIYNYIDWEATRLKAAEAVTDQTFDKFTFILPGRFHPQKNHALLLAAVQQIAHLPFKVLLVGKGGIEEQLKQEVAARGLQDKIIFMGFKANPWCYMAKSNCLLMTSHFEGFPNVLLESLACCTPIISTDCPTGPRELLGGTFSNQSATDIEQLPYGILIPLNDKDSLAKAMQMVMENPALLEQLKVAGLQRVKEYDITKTVNQFAEIINTL
jgi:N-acetylgalactosamine-N,N'-diacetylbacillosaminyl-diphospho-undecaprenol 4-alpha-N-acetylgalactosaminyltransferase